MPPPTPSAPLEHEAVSARARQLWQIAGSPAGRNLEFWTAAEAELRLDQEQTKDTAKTQSRPRKRV